MRNSPRPPNLPRHLRYERREGIKLTLVGGAFVVASIFMLFVVENGWLAFMGIAFFGAVMMVGLFKTFRPGRDLPPALAIIASFGMAAASLAMILSDLLNTNALGHREAGAWIIGTIGLVFFGGSGVVLLIRALRAGRAHGR